MQKLYKLKNIIINVQDTIKKQDFLVYFRKITIVELSDKEIVFWVVSSFMKDNLEAKFYNNIFDAAKLENRDLEKISFIVDNNIDNPSNTDVVDCSKISNNKKNKVWPDWEKIIYQEITNSKSVNDRYNLSNFIVWSDSQLAYSACEAVCRNPWKSYNPLYIYGDVW